MSIAENKVKIFLVVKYNMLKLLYGLKPQPSLYSNDNNHLWTKEAKSTWVQSFNNEKIDCFLV